MTLQELKNRYHGATFASYGHFRVSFTIRGKKVSAITTNTAAIDRIKDNEETDRQGRYKTQKQAYEALYNWVRDNGQVSTE